MKPLAASLLTGSLVVGGKMARGESPNIDNAIGVGGIAIGLSIVHSINAELGEAFGVLIVVAVLIVHFPVIVRKTGLMK